MKNRIITALLLSLLLVSIAVPLVGATNGDKAVIKEMVQAPGDYSVGTPKFDPFNRLDETWMWRWVSGWFGRLYQ